MKRHLVLLFVVFGVVMFPQRAWANAGTPLMWVEGLHLMFGNLVIGIGEGLLLGWLFSLPRVKSVAVMILANYASAWLGGVFIGGAIVRRAAIDLNNGWTWFWGMVAATYCLTLLLEWPFVAFCFRGARNWLRRSLLASLVIQTASYAILFGWYWSASGTSLYTDMNIVAPAEISLPESVLVYFISADDGDVYCRPLAGGSPRKVCELHSVHQNDRLFVRLSAAYAGRWDLVARLETADRAGPRYVDVLTDMPVEAAADWRSTRTTTPEYDGTWFNFGEVPKLGTADASPWKFSTGFWPLEGLRGENEASGQRVAFSYETPFGAWIVRNAVHLPSDKVLFQLDHDQICAFDPVTRRVALLWHGRGPVPVVEKSASDDTVGQQDTSDSKIP